MTRHRSNISRNLENLVEFNFLHHSKTAYQYDNAERRILKKVWHRNLVVWSKFDLRFLIQNRNTRTCDSWSGSATRTSQISGIPQAMAHNISFLPQKGTKRWQPTRPPKTVPNIPPPLQEPKPPSVMHVNIQHLHLSKVPIDKPLQYPLSQWRLRLSASGLEPLPPTDPHQAYNSSRVLYAHHPHSWHKLSLHHRGYWRRVHPTAQVLSISGRMQTPNHLLG